jgi:hypothetical protein
MVTQSGSMFWQTTKNKKCTSGWGWRRTQTWGGPESDLEEELDGDLGRELQRGRDGLGLGRRPPPMVWLRAAAARRSGGG